MPDIFLKTCVEKRGTPLTMNRFLSYSMIIDYKGYLLTSHYKLHLETSFIL